MSCIYAKLDLEEHNPVFSKAGQITVFIWTPK